MLRKPCFSSVLALCAAEAFTVVFLSAACAAQTPLGTNLCFGITMSPSSPLSAAQLDQLDQAGNNWVDLQFAWSAFEPAQGQYSSSYVQQIRTSIDDALSRGWRVGLRLSWHYPPTWATQLPDARFVDQYGDVCSDTGSSGKNVVAFTFNQNLRNIISLTMTNFFAQMQTNGGTNYLPKFSAIAIGGGFYGEVNLPEPSFNGHANCYWAYGIEAKSMFQAYLAGQYGTIAALNSAWGTGYSSFAAAGFTPGQASLNHRAASDFLNWLRSVQQQYVLFQRNLVRTWYDGYLEVLFGGWGMHSNYITSNLAVDLNGSGPGADSVSKVYDFGNFLRVLSEAGETKVLASCTWIDPNLSFSGTGNPAPVGWLAGFARQYGFLTCGEYTANSTALDLGAARVNASGLVLAFYVPASRLFTGSYPTTTDWGNMIDRSQRAFAASVPYLLSYDLGNVGTPGSDTIAREGVSCSGAGAGCLAGATSDNFHYFAAILEGDGQLVMKVNSMSADPAAQTGLMVRQALGASDAYTAVLLGNNQCVMQSRHGGGSATQIFKSLSGIAAPQWLKLERSGNTLSTYYSAEGTTWTLVGSQANTMAYASYIGVALSSGSSSLNSVLLNAADAPIAAAIYTQDFNAPGATPASLGWDGGFFYQGADSETHTISAIGVGGSAALVTTLHVTNGANLGAFTEFWSGSLRLPAGANASNLSLAAAFTGNQPGVPFSLKFNDHAGYYIVFVELVRSAGAFQQVGGPLSTATSIDPAFNFAGTGGYSFILSFDGPGGIPWANGTASLTIDDVVLQTVGAVSPFALTIGTGSGAGSVLTWPSVAGRSYVVQFKQSLTEADWTAAGPATIAGSETTSWTNAAAGPARFYRVMAR